MQIKKMSNLGLAAAAAALTFAPAISQAAGIGSSQLQNWTAQWWQWAFSIPDVPAGDGNSVHPLSGVDGTGGDPDRFEYCGTGQNGNLWFLGGDFTGDGSFFERTCIVPAGKTIVLAVINAECSTAEGDANPRHPAWRQARDLQTCVQDGLGVFLGGSARLIKPNGSDEALPVQRVATASAFPISFAPSNINGIDPVVNPSLAQADGQWAVIPPAKLRPGNVYEVEFEGTYDDPTTPDIDFVLNGAYRLVIPYRNGTLPPIPDDSAQ